jgi:hypothetical protein
MMRLRCFRDRFRRNSNFRSRILIQPESQEDRRQEESRREEVRRRYSNMIKGPAKSSGAMIREMLPYICCVPM